MLRAQDTAVGSLLERLGIELVLVLLACKALGVQHRVVPLLAAVLRLEVNDSSFVGR